MAKQISSLNVILGGTIAPFQKAFAGAGATISKLSGQLMSLGGTMLRITGISAAVGAAIGAIKGAGSAISLAAELEQTEVAFRTMLGSGAAASKMMQDLATFAASTPFEFPGIASAAKSLLAFGISSAQIPDTLRMIGDVAAGVGVSLEDLAQIYGKAKTQGRLMAEDINQLTGRGIPIIKELAKQFGVSEAEVKKLVEQGKIGFPQLEAAFRSMTGAGGQFAGLMEAQSKTLGGLWSTLKDNVGMTLAGLVRTIVDAFHLRDALAGLTAWIGTVGASINSAVTAWAPVFVSLGARIWSAISSTLSAIWATVGPIVGQITAWISANWQMIVSSTVTRMAAMWSVISGAFAGIWSLVQTAGAGIAAAWNWTMEALGIQSLQGSMSLQSFGSWLFWLEGIASDVLTTIGFAFRNVGKIIELVGLRIMLSIVQTGNQVAYVFGEVVPSILSWLGNNWRQIFGTLYNYTSTVFSNMAANVWNFFKSVGSWLTGGEFDFQWTALSEGFESTLSELPQIAEREIGGLEAALRDQGDALSDALGDGLGDALAKNRQLGTDAAKAIGDAVAGAQTTTIDAAAPDIQIDPPALDLDAAPALGKIDEVKAAAQKINDVAALAFGSAEQIARIDQAGRAGAITQAINAPARDAQAATVAPPAAAKAAGAAGAAGAANTAGLLEIVKQFLPQILAKMSSDRIELVEG